MYHTGNEEDVTNCSAISRARSTGVGTPHSGAVGRARTTGVRLTGSNPFD